MSHRIIGELLPRTRDQLTLSLGIEAIRLFCDQNYRDATNDGSKRGKYKLWHYVTKINKSGTE